MQNVYAHRVHLPLDWRRFCTVEGNLMKKKFIPLICLFVSPLSLADWSIGLDYAVLKDDYILSDEFSSNILLYREGIIIRSTSNFMFQLRALFYCILIVNKVYLVFQILKAISMKSN